MDFIKAENKRLVAGNKQILLRGFGLGGWFLPEGYMWKLYTKCDRPRRMEAMIETLCGKEYADSFWKRYMDSYITEKDIQLIAKEGYNSVRLPLNARHLYGKNNNQMSLLPEMISRIDQFIAWCKQYDIYVILDMHGAPGGQTGQNIDDSEWDIPLLFQDNSYEDELIFLWTELAKRYCNEKTVAGYDLLNEPVTNWFNQYNNKILPLYRKLIRKIREVDVNHLIILEGAHWATDFSIFNDIKKEEAKDNIMLEFHKYWNHPDYESIEPYMKMSDKLNIPLFMGEGGENNCDWYTTVFPMYERHYISWSFWSYKKMDCSNSPITFDIPNGWDKLISWIDEKCELSQSQAMDIFEHFIYCIKHHRLNRSVFNALNRRVPIKIPCEAYDNFHILSKRIEGASLRLSEPVSILFENGKLGDVNYKRYGGEIQPVEENLMVQLSAGDRLQYQFISKEEVIRLEIEAEGEGILLISLDTEKENIIIKRKDKYFLIMNNTPNIKHAIELNCMEGIVKLDNLYLQNV